MRRAALLALLALATLAAPARAEMDMPGAGVSIGYSAFGSPRLAVLAGESVTWRNDSVRPHIVSSVDGSFASTRLVAQGAFTHVFDAPGAVAYFCPLHPTMRGEVDVYRALLDAPKQAAAPRRPYVLTGRAMGDSVTIEPGGVTATVTDGRFSAIVKPAATTAYTATVDGDVSPAVQVLVLDRKIKASARGHAVTATVSPASPGDTVVLQLHLKERFGWWPVATAKLDAHSRVRFKVSRRARARVVLTASDGATPLARSGEFVIR